MTPEQLQWKVPPRRCTSCDKEIGTLKYMCDACWKESCDGLKSYHKNRTCIRCKRPIGKKQDLCRSCKDDLYELIYGWRINGTCHVCGTNMISNCKLCDAPLCCPRCCRKSVSTHAGGCIG